MVTNKNIITMTLNQYTMKNNKDCLHLDIAKKIKIKIDPNNRILYVNDYFTKISGFKVSEIILKQFDTILYSSMPRIATDVFKKATEDFPKFYFIIKGKTKDFGCFWSFLRVTQRLNKNQEFTGYLLEGKLLPAVAIQKIEKLHNILFEIEKNAGKDAALKYFNGFIEEKGVNFNEFILAIAEVDEKKAEKYFEIDEDAVPTKKKKRGWF